MKAILVPDDLHLAWKAHAKDEGITLSAYVAREVERVRSGEWGPRGIPAVVRPLVSTQVNPRDCTNRLPIGAWCTRCGSIHGRAEGKR